MLSSFVFVMKEVKKKLLPKKMATASNGTLNHQNHYHCTISLEGLAVRTTVTIRCHHTFHLEIIFGHRMVFIRTLNRLDEIVVFNPLSRDQLRTVARLQMKEVAGRLAERGIALAATDTALDYVSAATFDPAYGTRPIRRWLEKRVVTELSRMLIREELDENPTVYIDAAPHADGLAYQVEKNGGLFNPETGQKLEILIQVPNGPKNDTARRPVNKIKIEEIDHDEEMDDLNP